MSLSAYGACRPVVGASAEFDSLVQTATGFDHAEAQAAGEDVPHPLPARVLDHAAGYLLAFGAMAALHRRATEGGSWHVRVSLAQVGRWLRGLGRVAGGLRAPEQKIDDVADLLEVLTRRASAC
ncbi:CoA transferase [Cupriavidus basilensis]